MISLSVLFQELRSLDPLLRCVLPNILGYFHRTEVRTAHGTSPSLELRPDRASFAKAPIFAEKLRRDETADRELREEKPWGQG